jgi:hypothetical protein
MATAPPSSAVATASANTPRPARGRRDLGIDKIFLIVKKSFISCGLGIKEPVRRIF